MGQQRFRSGGAADAFDLSQRGTGHGFVKGFARKGGEVADALICRHNIDRIVAFPGTLCPRTGSAPVLGPLDEPAADGIARDIAQRCDQMRLVHRDRAEAALPQMCPVTRMRRLLKPAK